MFHDILLNILYFIKTSIIGATGTVVVFKSESLLHICFVRFLLAHKSLFTHDYQIIRESLRSLLSGSNLHFRFSF